MRTHSFRRFIATFFLWAMASMLLGATCSNGQHHTAVASIETLGAILNTVSTENRTVYERESNAAMNRVHDAGGTLEQVRAENAARERKFLERSDAIVALDAALVASAALADAAQAGGNPALYAVAAEKLLGVIQRSLPILRDGSVLPALNIPPQVDQIANVLRQIAASQAGASHG